MKLNHSGFTLIEMLVVISLIGILAALALVSFGGAQKQARDVTRKSDLKQYQTSIENYASKNNGTYPIHATTVQMGTLCTDLGMTTCFLDPKDPTLTYKYISNANGINYVLWSNLENKSVTTYWKVCSTGKNAESTAIPTLASCL